jgi:hypothetical protein
MPEIVILLMSVVENIKSMMTPYKIVENLENRKVGKEKQLESSLTD